MSDVLADQAGPVIDKDEETTLYQCDVLIVGARIAGTSLASMLGKLGYRVILVDRATFPSPTNSTHFFRGNGFVSTLARIGVLDEVLALGSPPLRCEYWYAHGASEPIAVPPQEAEETGFNLSVRREPLDALLIEHARQYPSIEIREHTRFLRPKFENDRVVGAQLETDEGEVVVTSHLLIGADGHHSPVAKAVNAPIEIDDEPIRVLLYQYVHDFAGPPTSDCPGPEFSVVENEIAFAFPSDSGVTCTGASINLDDFGDSWRNPGKTLRTAMEHHPGLAGRVFRATPVSNVMSDGRSRNVARTPIGPGWALIGDAGLRQDPWTARGMDCAGVHAGYLAEAIDEWFSGRQTESDAMQRYHQQRNEHGLPLFEETQTLGRDLRQMEIMQTPQE